MGVSCEIVIEQGGPNRFSNIPNPFTLSPKDRREYLKTYWALLKNAGDDGSLKVYRGAMILDSITFGHGLGVGATIRVEGEQAFILTRQGWKKRDDPDGKPVNITSLLEDGDQGRRWRFDLHAREESIPIPSR